MEDPDLDLLAHALHDGGAAPSLPVWDDPGVRWEDFDVVVVRATWDYVGRREAWLRWARHAEQVSRLHNPARVLAWSTDKRYVLDLARAGVATVPTRTVGPRAPRAAQAQALAASAGPTGEAVVKPVDGAGSRGVLRSALDDPVLADHLDALVRDGRHALVQPYLPSVDAAGERALVYVDGALSHALTKGPLLPSGRSAVEEGALFAVEEMTPATPSEAERAVAADAVAAVTARFGRLLYARVDLLEGADSQPQVLEVELAEPSLFHAVVPHSAVRFAEAILRRLG